jgi:hypothetical protein
VITAGAGLALWRRLREREAAAVPAPAVGPTQGGAGPVTSAAVTTVDAQAPAAPPPAADDPGREPTRRELYARAQALGIEGRSKMSKDELRRAVEERG